MTSQEFIDFLKENCQQLWILNFDSQDYVSKLDIPDDEKIPSKQTSSSELEKYTGSIPWWFKNNSVVNLNEWRL